jgi:hypothetical protein
MIHRLYRYFLTHKQKDKETYVFKWLRWQLYKYLKIGLLHYYKTLSLSGFETDKTSNVIVSLTSIPNRISDVHLVIKSVFNQSVKPHKIILWLGLEHFPNKESDLPMTLINLKKRGLDIVFCEDLKPHTKYFYTFQKYPKQLVVTVDDDLFYPKNMIETLLKFHYQFPTAVIANRVRNIGFVNGKFDNYRNWKINSFEGVSSSKKIFATGVGGVLYQPHLYSSELLNKKNIKSLSLNTDDVWLKANQMIDDIEVVWTNYYMQSFIELPGSQINSLHDLNVFNGQNDERIHKVFDFFGITKKSFED